jgi:hypothetical protein
VRPFLLPQTRLNADYAAHRQGDYGARPPCTFATWMASRGKLGGQNKMSGVIGDPAPLDGLRRAAGA